jgi:hypothetical protein
MTAQFPVWEETCDYCGAGPKPKGSPPNSTKELFYRYACPMCMRPGCPECMPAGNGCICPECDEGGAKS